MIFQDGSLATINYSTDSQKSFPKERIEIFSENSIYQIDNFKRLNIYSNRKKVHRSTYQDKGINQCIKTFCDLISSNPINFDYESFINEIFFIIKNFYRASRFT